MRPLLPAIFLLSYLEHLDQMVYIIHHLQCFTPPFLSLFWFLYHQTFTSHIRLCKIHHIVLDQMVYILGGVYFSFTNIW